MKLTKKTRQYMGKAELDLSLEDKAFEKKLDFLEENAEASGVFSKFFQSMVVVFREQAKQDEMDGEAIDQDNKDMVDAANKVIELWQKLD